MQAKTRLMNKIAWNFQEIDFEITSPGTPQKTGIIEQGFDIIY